jgi:hypothetical protein
MRISLFLGNLDEQYQTTTLQGITEEARAHGVSLTCVQCEGLPGTGPYRPASVLFSLARYTHFDGIIFLASVFSTLRDVDTALFIREHFADIPLVSAGLLIPGVPSITINNRQSMRTIMEHLIGAHRYRRFMFISGPESHYDSALREAVFTETIERYRSEFPTLESSVREADFTERQALTITREYIEAHPSETLDAIVAANDNMAIGCLKALRLAKTSVGANARSRASTIFPRPGWKFPRLPACGSHWPRWGGKLSKACWGSSAVSRLKRSCGLSRSRLSANPAAAPPPTTWPTPAPRQSSGKTRWTLSSFRALSWNAASAW